MEISIKPELNSEAECVVVNNELLPAKSRHRYEQVYKLLIDWQNEKKCFSFSEKTLIAYFNEKAKKLKPSSLWTTYSLLRLTLKQNHNVDISSYTKLKGMLRAKETGFVPKQSRTFSTADMAKFFNTAPDKKYLDTKIVSIFGISGAFRNDELMKLKFSDVKLKGDAFFVDIPFTKTYQARRIHIHEKFTQIIQKYMNLRPPNCTSDRFFLNYQREKCTCQAIGKNKFMRMPRVIAQFLKLPNAENYTGQAFRRTSATLLAKSGANIVAIQRQGGWKSVNAARAYINKSGALKNSDAQQISEDMNLSTVDDEQKNDSNPRSQPKPNLKNHYHFYNCTVYIQKPQ